MNRVLNTIAFLATCAAALPVFILVMVLVHGIVAPGDTGFRVLLGTGLACLTVALAAQVIENRIQRVRADRAECRGYDLEQLIYDLEQLIASILFAYIEQVELVCDDDKLRQSPSVGRALNFYEEKVARILREYPVAERNREHLLNKIDLRFGLLGVMAGSQHQQIERLMTFRELIMNGAVGDRRV